jgi:adenosylhomocysteine nucleosidase
LTTAGVVAALAAEARALGPSRQGEGGCGVREDGTLILVSGMGPEAAAAAARRLIEAGAGALVSWGMAGGLDPALEAGAVLVPVEIIDARGMRYATAKPWRQALTAAIARQCPVVEGALLSGPAPIDTIDAKSAAFRGTGAAGVDMESSSIAQVAAAQGLPFIAVRVIVDTAKDAVPAAVAAASRAGKLAIGRLLLGLVRSPRQIAPLMQLAQRYQVALRALAAAAKLGSLSPPAAREEQA